MKSFWTLIFLFGLFIVLALTWQLNAVSAQSVLITQFAVIGDYGRAGANEQAVAEMVKSWSPDFIITTGDNNYPYGASETIDANIGQYYADYISPYYGAFGSDSTSNRFFPSLGNHDWYASNAQPYIDYFTLPGNERYYDFVEGTVHFFVIDSDISEADGADINTVQYNWLHDALAASTAQWKIVYFHHSPYTSSLLHPSTPRMRWPFQDWGADIVLTGHSHQYERFDMSGFPYIVNGLGGHSVRAFGFPLSGSVVRYNGDFGAQLVTVYDCKLVFDFFSISNGGTLVDSLTLDECSDTPPTEPSVTDVPTEPSPSDTPPTEPSVTDVPTEPSPSDTPPTEPSVTDVPTEPSPSDTPSTEPPPNDTSDSSGRVTICHIAGKGNNYHILDKMPVSALNGHFNENGSAKAGHEGDFIIHSDADRERCQP